MGWFKDGIRELYIARPESEIGGLIYKWPNQSIPGGSKLTVRADEVAVFFRQGQVAGTLNPGPYVLDTASIPFLGKLLIDDFTNARHYITDLFFVRTAEYVHRASTDESGTYEDQNSNLVVTIRHRAEIGLRVVEPLSLIVSLGGVGAGSADQVLKFLTNQVNMFVRNAIGKLISEKPVLQVVSNQHGPEISELVTRLGNEYFCEKGLQITRILDLDLRLDDESKSSLQQFGQEMAKIKVMARTAEAVEKHQVGISVGANADAVKGLGEGLKKGSPSMMLLGGVGINVQTTPPAGAYGGQGGGYRAPVGGAPAPRTLPPPASRKWFLMDGGKEAGPYEPRLLALRAFDLGLDVTQAQVRRDGEPDWVPAWSDEGVKAQFERIWRSAPQRPGGSTPGRPAGTDALHGFEESLAACVRGGVFPGPSEVGLMLAGAIRAGLANTPDEARALIVRRLAVMGIMESGPQVQAPPVREDDLPPPPAAPMLFSYFDGESRTGWITAEAVARRVRGNPDGFHQVCRKGSSDWEDPRAVKAIIALLE